MDLTSDLKAIICESARVFGFELKEKQIVIEEHFLLQCQVSRPAEVVQRHKQQLGPGIQHERADVTYALVSHRAYSDLTPKYTVLVSSHLAAT